jgi:cutinase
MATLVQQAMTQCPSTLVVMSGYRYVLFPFPESYLTFYFSQGGQLVHNAAGKLPPAISAKVSSVVIFGDPNNGTAVGAISAAKTEVICHTGDDICAHGDLVLEPHLTYSQNSGEATSFVLSAAGGKGIA